MNIVFRRFSQLIINEFLVLNTKSAKPATFHFSKRSSFNQLHFTTDITIAMAGKFYAVARGRSVGIYNNWGDCKSQVTGFPNARFKKFSTQQEAQAFIIEHGSNNNVTAQNPTKDVKSFTQETSSSSTKAKTMIRSQMSSIFTVPYKMTSTKSVNGSRGFSTSSGLNKRAALKVTEDRITGGNKKAKLDEEANTHIDLSKFSVEDGYVVVFTDGACRANGKRGAKAGLGVWFGESHYLNISEPVIGRQTNNTAEIQAAERAIVQAKQNGITKLKLMTDSQFTINCVTKWMTNWKRKGWKLSNGQDVKNREDLIKLETAINGIEIKWSYVAGHKGHHGNEEADRLAVLGAQMN